MKRIRTSPQRSQRGAAMLFFAMIILPLLAVLMSITLDLGLYFRKSQDVQKNLDEAGMYAHQFWPFQDRTIGAAEDYLRSVNLRDGAEVRLVDQGINLQYGGQFGLNFPRLLGLNVALPINVTTRVTSAAYDVFIGFDASSYLAPHLPVDPTTGLPNLAPGGNQTPVWGQPVLRPGEPEIDPLPAKYVRDNNGLGGRPYCASFTGDEQLRCQQIISQQCFNPVFSRIKEGAGMLFEYYSASRLNNVELGFFPSSVNGYTKTLHPMAPGIDNIQQPYFLDDPAIGAQRDGGNFVSNADCALMADYQALYTASPTYNFPSAPAEIDHPTDPNRPQYIIDPGTQRPDLDYLTRMRGREATWSIAARSRVAGNEVTSDTAELIRQAYAKVTTAPRVSARGGLVNDDIKRIFLILGGMPRMVNAAGNVTALVSASASDPVANRLRNVMAELRQNAELYNQRINLQIFLVGYYYSDWQIPHNTDDPAWWTMPPAKPPPIDWDAIFGPQISGDNIVALVQNSQEPASLRYHFINRATDLRPVGVISR